MLLYFFFWYKSVFFYLKKRRRRKKKRIDKISIYCCRCCFPFPRPKFLGSTHALRLLRQNDGRKTYCRRVFVTMVKNTTHCAYQKLGINRVLACFNPVGEMALKSTFRLFLFNLYFPWSNSCRVRWLKYALFKCLWSIWKCILLPLEYCGIPKALLCKALTIYKSMNE